MTDSPGGDACEDSVFGCPPAPPTELTLSDQERSDMFYEEIRKIEQEYTSHPFRIDGVHFSLVEKNGTASFSENVWVDGEVTRRIFLPSGSLIFVRFSADNRLFDVGFADGFEVDGMTIIDGQKTTVTCVFLDCTGVLITEDMYIGGHIGAVKNYIDYNSGISVREVAVGGYLR